MRLNLYVVVAAISALTLTFPPSVAAAEAPKTIQLWPDKAPGEKGELPPEEDVTTPKDRKVAGKPVMRLKNVSKPTITIYRPVPANDTGTAVLVFPGGAYNIVALDLEGTEVCEWLNSIGVTGILVKYRVPRREGLEKHVAPLQDAQRAFGIVRQNAAELGIHPNRIGVLGFSAGGHLAASLMSSTADRTYPKVDAADALSCRPDFALLVYPAYLTPKEDPKTLSPEVAVSTNHPPSFIAMTEDDGLGVENALTYYLALKQNKIPAELHVYAKGGHGYGLRRTTDTVTTWPERATEWLKNQGLLSKK